MGSLPAVLAPYVVPLAISGVSYIIGHIVGFFHSKRNAAKGKTNG